MKLGLKTLKAEVARVIGLLAWTMDAKRLRDLNEDMDKTESKLNANCKFTITNI